MTGWTWAWLGWLVYFAVVEGAALYQSGLARGRGEQDPRDTLSEHVWWLFGVNTRGTGVLRDVTWWARLRRVVLGGFLLWLSIHFLAGGAFI